MKKLMILPVAAMALFGFHGIHAGLPGAGIESTSSSSSGLGTSGVRNPSLDSASTSTSPYINKTGAMGDKTGSSDLNAHDSDLDKSTDTHKMDLDNSMKSDKGALRSSGTDHDSFKSTTLDK